MTVGIITAHGCAKTGLTKTEDQWLEVLLGRRETFARVLRLKPTHTRSGLTCISLVLR
jgi:hypothetical protein